MAEKKTRKLTKEEIKELQETVKLWLKDKQVTDGLKKGIDARAGRIKELMAAGGLKELPSGDYVAKLSFQHKESMNEEALLNWILTDLWGDKGSMECPYVMSIPIINWDVLEKDIYNEKIPKEKVLEMDKFKEVVDTPVLKYAKIKKEDK